MDEIVPQKQIVCKNEMRLSLFRYTLIRVPTIHGN